MGERGSAGWPYRHPSRCSLGTRQLAPAAEATSAACGDAGVRAGSRGERSVYIRSLPHCHKLNMKTDDKDKLNSGAFNLSIN